MIGKTDSNTYNSNLLEGNGVRRRLHRARFHWVERWFKKLAPPRPNVFELGCFDARLLRKLGPHIGSYCGFDAGWQGGLAAAQSMYRDAPDVVLRQSEHPDDLKQMASGLFDLTVTLETLEHIPPDELEVYLSELARITRGHLIVSVPNEKGPILLGKFAAKKVLGWSPEHYTARELFLAAAGRVDLITRREHKGFDYDRLVMDLSRHFDVIAVENIALPGWPLFLSFSVGIVARPRNVAQSVNQRAR